MPWQLLHAVEFLHKNENNVSFNNPPDPVQAPQHATGLFCRKQSFQVAC
jgi:hypothetical protein